MLTNDAAETTKYGMIPSFLTHTSFERPLPPSYVRVNLYQ